MESKKIRLLIEAGPAIDATKSGVGYYVKGLLNAMGDIPNNFSLDAFYFNFLNRNKKTTTNTNVNYRKISLIPGKIISICKLFGRLPFLEIFIPNNYDVILYTNYVSLPTLKHKTKTAVTIYDLSFLDVPEYTKENNLKYLQKYSSRSIQAADLIITISDFTKNRIESWFPDTKGKIIITPIPPLQHEIKEFIIPEKLQNLGVTKDKYVLFVGTLEPRKNIVNLIRAYEALPKELQETYSLVLAGGSGWKDEEIKESILSAINKGLKIIQTGYISEEDRDALYANAALFVFPSHYEGFGMPLLEAMQYNIPIAVSDIPVFHEVAGDSVVYFDKDAPANIANTIATYINDSEMKNKLIATYSGCLNKYSWENNAKIVFNAFEKLVKK